MSAAPKLLSKSIDFVVEGRPMPQPKPRTKGVLRFYPKPYLEWRELVMVSAQAAAYELQDRGAPWDAFAKSYGVKLRFFQPDRRRTDIDRLAASVLDALTRAGMFEDDRLVSRLRAEREIDPGNPRVEIEVEVVG